MLGLAGMCSLTRRCVRSRRSPASPLCRLRTTAASLQREAIRLLGLLVLKRLSFSLTQELRLEQRGMPINGHTTGVSVLESDEKRAEKRESRYRNARGLNAGVNG